MRHRVTIYICSLLMAAFFLPLSTNGAPPVFEEIGTPRDMDECLFVQEGTSVLFTVSAIDPDGDPVVYSATNVPSWAAFDPTTGVFSGIAPYWPTNAADRKTHLGVFDVSFGADDGTYRVTNIVTLHIVATNWTRLSMLELVTNRPITAGKIGTPVSLNITSDDIVPTAFGGGKNLRRIEFSFTSQVASVTGWEEDWASATNFAYFPVDPPDVANVGGVIEGHYSGTFGKAEFAERACAEFNIPMLIIDLGWTNGTGSALMSKYNNMAVETGDPHYLFYVFSPAHYLRAVDALITLIDTETSWPVSYTNFRVIFTGHSKFGHTCVKAAAVDPVRVAGFMASGCPDQDSGASRLLTRLQGAISSSPETSRAYLGTIMRYHVEGLEIFPELSTNVQALFVMGSDNTKGVLTEYAPKYGLAVSVNQCNVPFRVGCIPNAPHTTQTSWHSTFWRMWIAHCFLDRPLSKIESVTRYPTGTSFAITAHLSGTPTVQTVRVWATDQSDLDITNWNGFVNYPMWGSDGVYTGQIPGDSTAFFVQVNDIANNSTGIITTAPWPTDCDYPLLREAPDDVADTGVSQDVAHVYFNWANPQSPDFSGIMTTFSSADYPSGPASGTAVYDGTSTSFTHSAAAQDTGYYALFTYDASGNYSDGVGIAVDRDSALPLIGSVSRDTDRTVLDISNLSVGYTNCIESATNLSWSDWQERTNFVPEITTTNWSESIDPNAPDKFYRVTVRW